LFFLQLSGFEIFAWIIGFLLALVVHEAAHAACANFLGDPTAKFAGRISLDPRRHLDPMGTIFLLFVGFGWGKPVPINPANFVNPRAGEILTALAGPLANLVTALILALPYNFLTTPESLFNLFFQILILVNILILVFNLLPIPPLDGGGVVVNLLPSRLAIIYRQYGPVILFSLIAAGVVFNISILREIIEPVVNIVWTAVNLSTRFGG
jgi:Zn-dependent protease